MTVKALSPAQQENFSGDFTEPCLQFAPAAVIREILVQKAAVFMKKQPALKIITHSGKAQKPSQASHGCRLRQAVRKPRPLAGEIMS